MPYRYLEDVSIADVCFEATGKTASEMFEAAGLATTNVMVKDLATVKKKVAKKVTLKHTDLEKLLFEFLQEFVYWKDKDLLLFSGITVKIATKEGVYHLSAVLHGEPINPKRHEMLVDVKAVTWHLFKIEHASRWKCQVVLDI